MYVGSGVMAMMYQACRRPGRKPRPVDVVSIERITQGSI
jgi:hypothetical protein